VTGLIGSAGAVAYGFDTIHMSLGDTSSSTSPAPRTSSSRSASSSRWALVLMGGRRRATGLALARCAGTSSPAVALPVAHIGNVATLAVALNVLLVLGFGSLVWRPPARLAGGKPEGVEVLAQHVPPGHRLRAGQPLEHPARPAARGQVVLPRCIAASRSSYAAMWRRRRRRRTSRGAAPRACGSRGFTPAGSVGSGTPTASPKAATACAAGPLVGDPVGCCAWRR
jgi:hypothetical protein